MPGMAAEERPPSGNGPAASTAADPGPRSQHPTAATPLVSAPPAAAASTDYSGKTHNHAPLHRAGNSPNPKGKKAATHLSPSTHTDAPGSLPLVFDVLLCGCGCCACCREPCSRCGCCPSVCSRRVCGLASVVVTFLAFLSISALGSILDGGGADGFEERGLATLAPPLRPTKLTAVSRQYRSLRIGWSESNPASSAENHEPEGYAVYVSNPLHLTEGKAPPEVVFVNSLEAKRNEDGDSRSWVVTLENLEPGSNYCMQVCGSNGAGSGESSETFCFRTLPAEAPLAPGAPAVVKGNATSLWIAWEPGVSRGYPIKEYEIECRRVRGPKGGGRTRFRTVDTSESHGCPPALLHSCPSRMTPGSWYEVRVRAMSSGGASEWGPSSIMHTDMEKPSPGPPCPLKNEPRVQKATPKEALLVWERPHDNGSEILSYIIRFRDMGGLNESEWKTVETSSLPSKLIPSIILKGLVPLHEYEASIASANAFGQSDMSSVVTFQTSSAVRPGEIGNVNVKVLNGTVASLRFPAPESGGMDIVEYQVQTDDWFWGRDEFGPRRSELISEDMISSKGEDFATVVTMEIRDLLPAGGYKLRMRAVSDAGSGEWSDPVKFETPEVGKCATRQNMHVYSEIPDIKDKFADCMIPCSPLRTGSKSRECSEECIVETLGLSLECAKCYSESSFCIIRRCAFQCINPRSKMCHECNKAKCVPLLRMCTGVPEWGLKIPY